MGKEIADDKHFRKMQHVEGPEVEEKMENITNV